MIRIRLACAVLMFATACSQEVPSKPPAPAVVAPAAALAADTAIATLSAPGDSSAVAGPEQLREFSIELATPDCSSDPVAVATARWDVTARKVTDVAIFVESPGNEAKLWLEGAATGDATTGKWTFANSRFTLRNRVSGEVLATRVVGDLACPN